MQSETPILSIDQNSNPLWDPVPKLHAIVAAGYRPLHQIEDVDTAFTRRSAFQNSLGTTIEPERFYRDGASDWGASLFYSRLLGRNSIDLREIEPYTGWTTAALSRRLGLSVDQLYDRYSDSDNLQMIGPSFSDESPLLHRTLGALTVSEVRPHLSEMMRLAESDIIERFPESDARTRIREWFTMENRFLSSWISRNAGALLPALYGDWMARHVPGVEIGRTSDLLATGPVAENGHRLLAAFLRDYSGLVSLYNRALEETGSGLRPLSTTFGELPFFLLTEKNGHLLRTDLRFNGNELLALERNWTVGKNGENLETALRSMREDGVRAVAGKALLLVLQARMKPGGFPLALPRKGSIYMKTAYRFEEFMRGYGAISDCHPVIRVRLRFTDAIGKIDRMLSLPTYLRPVFGCETLKTSTFSEALPGLMFERERELQRLTEPSERERLIRTLCPGADRQREEWVAERRRCAETRETRSRLPEINGRIRDLEKQTLEKLVARILENINVANLDYWDSRGAILPWMLAAGGDTEYRRVVASAELTAESVGGEETLCGPERRRHRADVAISHRVHQAKRAAIIGFYSPRVSRDRESHEILDWSSRESQMMRFEVFSAFARETAPRNNFSVLDVGCGLADLDSHLRAEFPEFAYFGVDLTLDVLGEAARRRPGIHLVNADSLHHLPFRPGAFDYLFCSGVFNLETGENERDLNRALPILGLCTSVGLVVNLLHGRAKNQYPHCHYYDPEHVAALAAGAFPEATITILDDYLENDFTLRIQFENQSQSQSQRK